MMKVFIFFLCIVHIVLSAEKIAFVTQYHILRTLYLSTNGSSWKNTIEGSHVWEFDSSLEKQVSSSEGIENNVCKWHGIRCEEVHRILNNENNETGVERIVSIHKIEMAITEIDLSQNNLSGELPWQVFFLPDLMSLRLSSNRLEQIDLQSVPSSGDEQGKVNLFNLGRDEEQFLGTGIEYSNTLLSSSSTLKVLDVSDNLFHGNLSQVFSNLFISMIPSIEDFNLSSNYFNGSIPDSELHSQNMPMLRILDLSSQKSNNENTWAINDTPRSSGLSGPVPDFASFRKLEKLNLQNNMLSGSIPNSFLQMSSENPKFNSDNMAISTTVDLSYNSITGVLPLELRRFERLNLYLHNNYIHGIPHELCNRSYWMDSNVLLFGCDGILCPPGEHHESGRQISIYQPCMSCDADLNDDRQNNYSYYGQTSCTTEKEMVTPSETKPSKRSDFSRVWDVMKDSRFWLYFIMFIFLVAAIITCCTLEDVM